MVRHFRGITDINHVIGHKSLRIVNTNSSTEVRQKIDFGRRPRSTQVFVSGWAKSEVKSTGFLPLINWTLGIEIPDEAGLMIVL